MSAAADGAVPEELVTFVQALAEDDDLRAWFESLAATPEAARVQELRGIAAKMQAAGEHADLVRATALLADPRFYRAVQAALAR